MRNKHVFLSGVAIDVYQPGGNARRNPLRTSERSKQKRGFSAIPPPSFQRFQRAVM